MAEPFAIRKSARFVRLCCVLALGLLPAVARSQSAAPDAPAAPADTDVGFLQSQGAQPRFEGASKISPDAAIALQRQPVSTIPHFASAFAFEGKTFPFIQVGAPPQAGGTTEIPTQLIAVSVLLEGFTDEKGDPIVLSPGSIVGRVSNSPNFRNATYRTGFTQFADAVQRAEFWGIMAQGWHTLLKPPELLKPVTVQVPQGLAKVYRSRSTGAVYAVIDTAFFISHLNTIVQMADLHPDSLALLLTSNVFLAPKGEVAKCCVLGFHTSFDSGSSESTLEIQTLVWASWIDQGILGTTVADVTPLTHEISEWMNDPFGTNLVPSWQAPDRSGVCSNYLETADPLATLPNAGFPILVDGFTYHVHNQVLLPWFTRQSPSSSIDGAFSFPDEGLVSRPSQPCGR